MVSSFINLEVNAERFTRKNSVKKQFKKSKKALKTSSSHKRDGWTNVTRIWDFSDNGLHTDIIPNTHIWDARGYCKDYRVSNANRIVCEFFDRQGNKNSIDDFTPVQPDPYYDPYGYHGCTQASCFF